MVEIIRDKLERLRLGERVRLGLRLRLRLCLPAGRQVSGKPFQDLCHPFLPTVGRRGFIVRNFVFFYNNATPSAFYLTELIKK